MFTQFRVRYPKGSLVTELSAIDHGKYIVRCLVQDEGATLVTSLAAADTVELAEDRARSRALAILGIDSANITRERETLSTNGEVLASLAPTLTAATPFSEALGDRSLPNETTHATIAKPNTDATVKRSQDLESNRLTQFSDVTVASDTSSLFDFEPSQAETAAPIGASAAAGAEIPFADEPDEFSSAEVDIPEDVDTPLWTEPNTPLTQPHDTPAPSYLAAEPETNTNGTPATDTPVDFRDIIARTNVELKRLGWTNQQGRDYLIQTYGKRSRQLLTDTELIDFLRHLESEPTPGE